ncbi:MAG TPA: hypothetical protein VFZ97_18430 [Acidimicrobiales bacterium]
MLWGGTDELTVLGFSTRPVGAEVLGFNRGSLEASGFPPDGAEVTPCSGSYQQALVGVHDVATTELGVEFKMSSKYVEEDKGLVLAYEGPDGILRTLDVPIDVSFCASPGYCSASAS